MDDQTRVSLIAAAAAATGPATSYETLADWQAALHGKAITLAVMSSADGSIGAALDSIATAKKFVGTVLNCTKEQRSTRGLVLLHTGTDRVRKINPLPPGLEEARTDRTDNPVGLAMARTIKSLIGHRVLVWVAIEEFTDGQGDTVKVRVIKHVEDLGADQDFAAKQAVAA